VEASPDDAVGGAKQWVRPGLRYRGNGRLDLTTDHSLLSRAAIRRGLCLDAVFHQLDDINAMGDALVAAARDQDAEHIANLRASLGRFAVAMGWHAETALPAILAYIDKHSAFAEELFAPAFLLRAIAAETPETAALLARLPESVRALLPLLDESTMR
jgi:hypothetical protein